MARKKIIPRYRQAVQKGVRGVTQELREALRNEAERRNLSINDLCVNVLAEHFNVNVEPPRQTGATPAALTDRDDMTIRMPIEMRNIIRHDAIDRGMSDQALILDVLAQSVGVVA